MLGDGNWLSHGFKRAPSLFEAQAALGWGVVVALLILAGVLSLTVGSGTVVSGYNMQQMTWELQALQQENTKLEALIAEYQSVQVLQKRAEELGFVPAGPDDIEYLRVNDYPPVPDEPVLASAQAKSAGRKTEDGWWNSLSRGFGGWTQATAVGGD